MPRSREERIATRTRNAKWKNAPLRIDMTECINCDACLRHCPPDFGAIFNHGADVIIVPELVSNSLIVSTTPRYYEEIARVIEEFDDAKTHYEKLGIAERIQIDLHEGGHLQPQQPLVEPRVITSNHPRLLQCAHPAEAG